MKRLSLLPFLLLCACTETIVMDPLEEMPVVVRCVLTRDLIEDGYHPGELEPNDYVPPMQFLDLYRARGNSKSGDYIPINDAEVIVSGAGERFSFEWNGSRWQCRMLPLFNREYKLKVITSDGDTLSATATFPPALHLGNYPIIDIDDNWEARGACYYYLARHYDMEWENGPFTHYICKDDVYNGECALWLCAKYNNRVLPRICSSHSGCDGFNIRTDLWGNSPVFRHLEDLFYFRCNYNNEQYNHIISQEGLSEEEKKIQLEKLHIFPVDEIIWIRYKSLWYSSPMHYQYLRIKHPAHFDSGLSSDYHLYVANDYIEGRGNIKYNVDPKSLFVVGVDFDTDWDEYRDDVNKIYLNSVFVSVDYDLYLRDLFRNTIDSDEFSSSYNRAPVHSNIRGGIGIFGCEWKTYNAIYL